MAISGLAAKPEKCLRALMQKLADDSPPRPDIRFQRTPRTSFESVSTSVAQVAVKISAMAFLSHISGAEFTPLVKAL